MWRTILVIAILGWLLLAASATFVPGVWSAPAGRLDVTCDRDSVPRGADSLLRCTYTATNTSATAWDEPQIFFQPAASVAIPDRYFFFTYRKEGVEERHEPFQTNYAFGRIEPGASSEIELEIIVNSQHDFGAEVALSVTGDNDFTDRKLSYFRVTDNEADRFPPLYGSVVRFSRDEAGTVTPSVAEFLLVLQNSLDAELAPVSVEVFAPDYGVTSGLDNPVRRSPSAIGGFIERIPARSGVSRTVRVETRGACAYAQPAMVARSQPPGGEPVFAAMLPPVEAVLLNCDVSGLGLPTAGTGVVPPMPPLRPFPLALGASGAVLALLGIGRLSRAVRLLARARRPAVR